MARELRIGDRVRTPWGDGVVASAHYHGMRGHIYDVAIRTEKGGEPAVRVSSWHVDNLEPLPCDIPRERVADLHAAVTKRMEQIRRLHVTAPNFAREELETFAEALRLLLEVDDAG